MADYKHPEVLVSTDWVAQHLNDPKVRLVEVDVDTSQYDQGHIQNAVGWNWTSQLCDNVRRDILTKAAVEKLLSASGIGNDTTVIFYGDNNNWFAAYALWQLKYWGHGDVRLMNGGRKKWVEEKRTRACAPCAPTSLKPSKRATSIWWMCARRMSSPAR
jgi:thiosulfate/3-mercaptopyruvate sulfurtransferase